MKEHFYYVFVLIWFFFCFCPASMDSYKSIQLGYLPENQTRRNVKWFGTATKCIFDTWHAHQQQNSGININKKQKN